MSFLDRDFVHAHDREGRRCRPINLAGYPAVNDAEDGIGRDVFLLADIGNRAVDHLEQQMALVGHGVEGFGRIPTQALGGGGMIVTVRTAEALGLDADIDDIAEACQMAEHERPVIAVEGANRLATAATGGSGQGTFDLDNQLPILGQFGM